MKIITALKTLAVTATVLFTAVTTPAQNIPIAAPVDRPTVNLTRFPNVHGNAFTNGAGVTYTNADLAITPNQPFNLTIVITNAPATGSATFHFDTSSDNGASYTGQGQQSNGVFWVLCTFTSTMRSNTVQFTTNITAATVAGVTDVKLRRVVPATVGTTNVYPYRAYLTKPKVF